jgi:hypothetical protein
MVYFVLWLLPVVSSRLKLDLLAFFAKLPSISFPSIVIYVMFVPLAIGTIFWFELLIRITQEEGSKRLMRLFFFTKKGRTEL